MPVRVKQHDITDCGAACIVSIASHYKLELPVSRIRQLAFTDQKGTNVMGLIQALEKLGFHAKGVRAELASLSRIPVPAIAHVVIRQAHHHFMVIYRVNDNEIRIMDPADGEMHRYSSDEFARFWSGALVILQPGENFVPGNKHVSTLFRLLSLLRPHRSFLIQAVGGSLIYTIIGLSTSIYVQKIVDYVLPDSNRGLLNLMTIGMLALLVLQILVGALKNVYILLSAQAIDVRLILGYYNHVLNLPQQFFDSMRIGEILSRVNDAVKIRNFINEALTNITVNFFIVIFSLFIMLVYHWQLTVIVIAVVPFYALTYAIANRLNRKLERTQMENAAELESQLVESLSSIHTVKNFGLETYSKFKTEIRFITLIKKVYASGLNFIVTGSASEFLSRLTTIILLWAGAGYVLENAITPGELLSMYTLVGYFTAPVNSLIGSNRIIQSALIAGDRLFEIMDLEHEKSENQVDLMIEMIGDIRFRNVKFCYRPGIPIFEGLNLVIPKNKVTALVGESGSGKSTLISILNKSYPVHSGSTRIGDYELSQISTRSIRSLIGFVPQKVELFAGNVVENIAPGDYHPQMKKIIETCVALGMLEFIEKLPQGFNTIIGENGATLSGGQKQRIAIARALYKDPQILIFDEPTAALDPIAESFLKSAIDLLRDRCAIIVLVSHRLSTVRCADKIVVLDELKVVEEGTHRELMENGKKYYHLWKDQISNSQFR